MIVTYLIEFSKSAVGKVRVSICPFGQLLVMLVLLTITIMKTFVNENCILIDREGGVCNICKSQFILAC